MPDPDFDTLLDRLGETRENGGSPQDQLRMIRAFIEKQAPIYSGQNRDAMLDELTALGAASRLFQAIANAKSPSGGLSNVVPRTSAIHDFGMGESPEEKEARIAKGRAMIARENAAARRREAAHRKRRLARGLGERAGSGKPEPAIELEALPEKDLRFGGAPYRKPRLQGDKYESDLVERNREMLRRMPIGMSRFGGLPDLPKSVEWPMRLGKRLPFVAQIDLSTLPRSSKLLPKTGWLYLFVLASNDKRHLHPIPFVIFHHAGRRTSLARAPWPEDDEIWADWTGVRVYETIPLRVYQPKKRAEPVGQAPSVAGWLFDEPWGCFGTPGEWADEDYRDGDDWINLLAVQSVGTMQWSDVGHLYVNVRRRDLVKKNFSDAMLTVGSS